MTGGKNEVKGVTGNECSRYTRKGRIDEMRWS